MTEVRVVTEGPFQGLIGLVTPFEIEVTARRADGAEAMLRRTVQTANVPIWEFGLFSEGDAIFVDGAVISGGGTLSFGGRVHINGDLYVTTEAGPITFEDRVSVVGEIVRNYLPNGFLTSSWAGSIRLSTAPGAYRNLGTAEGSVTGDAASAPNEPLWTNLSTGTYNARVINGRTGARELSLPLRKTAVGGETIDLIRRPPASESDTSQLFAERHFSQASMRILLSDTAADITSLPSVTGTAPVALGNLAVTPIPGYSVASDTPPFALSKDGTGPTADGYDEGYRFPLDTPLLGGFLKIEIQTAPGVWQDVTVGLLNLGIAGRAISGACPGTPNPNAVVRLQRVQDDLNQPCGFNSTDPHDYWPNVLYDTREGIERDVWGAHYHNQFLGGVMHYIELDVNNLRRWFEGTIGTSGTTAMSPDGYLVYFSDRRSNRDTLGRETGEYGFEDFVNTSGTGLPNGVHEQGEDVNGNGTLETYGQFPVFPAGVGAGTAPLDASARPWTPVGVDLSIDQQYVSRANPAIFFRRALKLVSGSLGSLPMPGLTITSENPVYIQGDYNADGGFGTGHAAAAVIADAVTVLSNAWNDWNSFDHPHDADTRVSTNTWYRVAIGTGTSLNFPRPSGTPTSFGTDGGVLTLLRSLEDWSNDLFYRGALAMLFTSRQGRGTFKCCGPTESVFEDSPWNFEHDSDFLNLSLMPPRTPYLTDVNITGFTNVITPTQ